MPRHKYEDNDRVDLKSMAVNTRNCVDSAQDRYNWKALVNATQALRVS